MIILTMTELKSDFLHVLTERGYIHQQTDAAGLDQRAASGIVNAYIGFDATADSLHVGSLVQIMLLRHLQQTGHRPIVLMGGGTTKVGDPSGRDETRQLLTDEQINANIAGIREIFGHFLRFDDSPTGAVMANNDDWLSGLKYIPFLRDIGRHFSINRMLTMDSVKLRLEREQPLSFLEFNYMILQGYDFVELNKRYGCTLQMGGSDQWGNILQGVELGRRVRETELFGLTSPLITTSSGAKMGKTASGAVWLSARRLSAYDYWQYWRNTEDGDVGRFLRMFTDLPWPKSTASSNCRAPRSTMPRSRSPRRPRPYATAHEAAREASETAAKAFSGTAAEGLPTMTLASGAQLLVLDAVVALGMAASKSEARRLIDQGGVKLNDQPVTVATATVSAADMDERGMARLAVGKKRHGLIRRE
jgi:tyrosyl-tRNA synthetase